jgi:hypothetical protein
MNVSNHRQSGTRQISIHRTDLRKAVVHFGIGIGNFFLGDKTFKALAGSSQ